MSEWQPITAREPRPGLIAETTCEACGRRAAVVLAHEVDDREVRVALCRAHADAHIANVLRATEPRHVWIVSGESGSYEDRCEWTVAAFTSREEADALCKRLNDWCRAHDAHPISRTYHDNENRERHRRISAAAPSSPDPFFWCIDATTYTVRACALGGAHRDCAECRRER